MRLIILIFMFAGAILVAAMPAAALAQPVAVDTVETSTTTVTPEADGIENAGTDVSVDFVWNPPGRMVSVGSHRLHIDCVGNGPVTVLFEAGLGGSSLEWQDIQREIAGHSQACTYDRGGYGWSDPAGGKRNATTLARETNLLLNNLNIRGPLILVGHSFGGFVIRELANLRRNAIVGLILVDASHEKQILEFERIMPIANMPTGRSFVISPITPPEGLDPVAASKIKVFGRMKKTYHAVHAEMASFRQSAIQAARLPRPVKYPIVVIRRGRELFKDDEQSAEKTQLWQRLQADLVSLSETGRLEIATGSGHHVHLDEPQRLVEQIQMLLDRYEQTI